MHHIMMRYHSNALPAFLLTLLALDPAQNKSHAYTSHTRWCNILFPGDIVNKDPISFVKTDKYIGFCVYHRSYLLWLPVIVSHEHEIRG